MSSHRRKILIVLLGAIVVTAGCLWKVSYRYADWLVLWKLDQYFDLSREQKAVLAGQLKGHLARHRNDALPAYMAALRQLGDRVRKPITREDVDWAFATYQRFREELFEGFVADGTAFLVSVDEEQIRNLEERFRKDNEKAERRLQEPARQRLAERAEETLELLRDWLGPLSPEQEKRITELSLTLPEMKPLSVQFHRERQQVLMRLLRQSPRDREAIAQGLRDWVVHPERRESAAFRRTSAEAQRAVAEMAVAVDRMATPRQREHVLKKLQALIDELQDLSAA